jgi:hypothetical protein
LGAHWGPGSHLGPVRTGARFALGARSHWGPVRAVGPSRPPVARPAPPRLGVPPCGVPHRPPTPPVLSQDDLNRATLARQLLLQPAKLDAVTAVERIGGLQAQEPASPFIGLWTRLADLGADELRGAFADRRVVKATMMRATLHAVTAADYEAMQPAAAIALEAIRRRDRALRPDPEHLERLTTLASAFTSEPRTLGELRDHLLAREGSLRPLPDTPGPDFSPEEIVWWLRRHMTFIHAPSDAEPWSFGRRPRVVEASAWLPGRPPVEPSASTVALVRRYLGAFGPATAADIGAWSGVPIARLRPAVTTLDEHGALWHAHDERGRALVDLVDAPRPPGDTPAPPRLLPMWDSVLLAHQDRTRIISDADRSIVIARNGDTLPTFLVDGRVAGLWWADAEPGGPTRIAIEPFRAIRDADRRALESEAERLAAFVESAEPRVYGRYQRWRPASQVSRVVSSRPGR